MDWFNNPVFDVKCGGMTGRTVADGEEIAATMVQRWNACADIPNPSAIREVVEAAKDALRSLLKLADPRDEAWDRAARLVAALAKLEGRSND
jgi:hypothetical protein